MGRVSVPTHQMTGKRDYAVGPLNVKAVPVLSSGEESKETL